MARVTISELLESLKALQEVVDSLKEEVDALRAEISVTTQVQLVADVRDRPEPLSQPINFVAMMRELSGDYATYSESSELWGYPRYL